MAEELRSPYPWQGGKSRVAEQAWAGLGPDCVNYIEPFFGSGAMPLLRPGGPGKIETVNDLDGAIPNPSRLGEGKQVIGNEHQVRVFQRAYIFSRSKAGKALRRGEVGA